MSNPPNPEDYKSRSALDAKYDYMADWARYFAISTNDQTDRNNAAGSPDIPVASSSHHPPPFFSVSSSIVVTHLPTEVQQVVDGVAQAPRNPRTGWPVRRWLGEHYPIYFSKKGVLRKKTALQKYRSMINWPDYFWAWLEDYSACEG